MVGRIGIRHKLNDFLFHEGGHIGYFVRPSRRAKGFATEMLKQILETDLAKKISILLLTCDEGNFASEKTILNNGGQLENIVSFDLSRPPKKRFPIPNAPPKCTNDSAWAPLALVENALENPKHPDMVKITGFKIGSGLNLLSAESPYKPKMKNTIATKIVSKYGNEKCV